VRGDRGSGTLLVLGPTALLLFAAMTATTLVAVAVARHRAASAADLAALAVAGRVADGTATACAAGRRTAINAGAGLRSCTAAGAVAEVVAAVRPPGWPGWGSRRRVRAAGPARVSCCAAVGQAGARLRGSTSRPEAEPVAGERPPAAQRA
jgi:secretion/DNA translocation related TadE-like protein